MRLGCGCLIGMLLLGVVCGGGWLAFQMSADPGIGTTQFTATDAKHAQEKIYAIVSKSAPRGTSIAISETELNAFITRNLEEPREMLTDVHVDLSSPPKARIAGRRKLAALLSDSPLVGVLDSLPASWLARTLWLELTTTPRVRSVDGRRRYVRLELDGFRIGRQPLPAMFARLLLDPGTLRLLQWSLPETVQSVTIEPGRVLVRLAS
jgi:hypothetical protein